MQAMVWTRYGAPEVLQLQEVAKPTPKDNEVMIKVYAATVTTGDCEVRSLKLPVWLRLFLQIYFGLSKPKRITILGQELAGKIEAIGKAVTRFKKGDAVFVATQFRFGAYAQYACLPETYAVLKPANMTYEEAATIPVGGVSGLHFLRAANVQSGQKILIHGAGGSIGTYAVQIAKSLGAEVTVVDSAEKLAMLRSIGADHAIDYTREDFTQSDETYDAIIDVVGKSSFSGSIRVLKENGHYVLGNPSLLGMLRARWASMTSTKKVSFEQASYKHEHYAFLKTFIEAGKLKSVIDRRYPLEQTVAAHLYVETGHKKGNVVITVEPTAAFT